MGLPLPTRTNGQIIDQTWFNLINDELVIMDDNITEMNTGLAYEFVVDGYFAAGGAKTGFMEFEITQNSTLLSASLKQITAGASGNFEVDVKYKRGGGSYTSVFTTKPKIPAAAGNNANSDTGSGATAAVIDSTNDELQAGDFLRLDLTIIPGGTPEGFRLKLPYELTEVA